MTTTEAVRAVPLTTGYSTLQFHTGGLFDGKAIDNLTHLVRRAGHGTPGPTLCGIDRFRKGSPGWSVGGGFNDDRVPCSGCDKGRDRSLPVTGLHQTLFPVGANPQEEREQP